MPIKELPPLPAVGKVAVEIFGGDVDADRWDAAKFDDPDATWASAEWRDVTPESLSVEVKWGADDPQGILTVPAASSWGIKTYDPDRKLDPTNGVSGYAAALKPGHPFRVRYLPEGDVPWTVRHGFIDEVEYDFASKTGALRGTDAVQLMVGAVLPAGLTGAPDTLRARAKWLIAKGKLANIVKVEGDRDWAAMVRELAPYRWYRNNEKFVTDPMLDRSSKQGPSGYYSGTDANPHVFMRKASVVSGADPSVWTDGLGSINIPDFGVEAWTLCYWIKWDDTLVTQYPTGPRVNPYGGVLTGYPTYNIRVWLEIDGYMYVGPLDDPSTYYIKSKSAIPTDTLSHLIGLSRDNTGFVRIWMDGLDVTDYDVLPEWAKPKAASDCTIANSAPAFTDWVGWSGYVDEVVVYDRVLSQDEFGRLFTYGMGLDGDYDPPVGPVIEKEASVWAQITTSAYDALYAVWLDRLNVVRFRSFGQPRSIGVQVGGALGMGIDTVVAHASMQGVFTRVLGVDTDGYNPDAPVFVEAIDAEKSTLYGDIVLKRDHPVPEAQAWVDAILQDRASSTMELTPGTIRPQTHQDMVDLLNLGMMDEIDLVVESADPQINVNPRVLGGAFYADTDAGWSAQVVSYVPSDEWEDLRGPAPPPYNPGDPARQEWRTYLGTFSARLVSTPNANAGNGKGETCGVGAFGNRNRSRMIVKFQPIDFTGVVAIDQAQLQLWTAKQCMVIGKTPKVIVRRILKPWNEGSYGVACGWSTTNAVVWPGPNGTQAGQVTKAIPRTANQLTTTNIPAIVRQWFAGQPQQGVKIVSVGEDNPAYATEFHAVQATNQAWKPALRVLVRIPT